MWVGSALVLRQDPHPLLKPRIVFCHWFLLPGLQCSCCLGTDHGLDSSTWPCFRAQLLKPSSWFVLLQFQSGQGQLPWKQSHGAQENGNNLSQLPSCIKRWMGWTLTCIKAPTDISKSQGAPGLPITVGGLKPPLHCEWRKAAPGMGGTCTTNGNWTHFYRGSIFHMKLNLLPRESVTTGICQAFVLHQGMRQWFPPLSHNQKSDSEPLSGLLNSLKE